MELIGLEPRRNDLARGIVIARSTRTLSPDDQRALWTELAAAGVTEADEPTARAADPEADAIARQWLAAPWLPPTPSEVVVQRGALERAAVTYGLEAVWLVKLETGIDGLAWLEMTTEAPDVELTEDPAPDDPAPSPTPVAEVLYAAPDAPAEPVDDDDDDDDELDDDEEDELQSTPTESYWRNGSPPLERVVEFPIERFPDMIDDYDGDRLGISLKLGGGPLPGEESVINAFFALWLSAYQDERTEEFEPFFRADVVHDRAHRSALMWVERFSVPVTAADQVHFLLWIAAQIHAVIPLAWARFEPIDEAVKSRAVVVDGTAPFILGGNPFAERFRRHGEPSALTWAVGQSTWSRRELAGMLVEVALEHDPDAPDTAEVAERLLRRALAFAPGCDAPAYLAIVLIRQHRVDEAIELARTTGLADVCLLVIGEVAEHAPDAVGSALELISETTIRETDPEEVAELVASVARHAPMQLDGLLALVPAAVPLVPHLYNASFTVERPQALAILRRVLSLPPPPVDAGEARTAQVMAWNNACIHAHALGQFELAVELAEGGQSYGPENPYIYHSAACAYAAMGERDRAIDQVRLAIEHEYEHSEKMETDSDLTALHAEPRFTQLFVDWRTRRADLN